MATLKIEPKRWGRRVYWAVTSPRLSLIHTAIVLAATTAAAWMTPLGSTAQACGGTFCDSGPTAMPVEQTGETILFVVDGTHVEAHIQIEYDPTTEASQFAWVIPVTALPEFSVGSQELISRLLNSTTPSYGTSTWNEPCNLDEGGGGFDDGCTGGNEPPPSGESGGLSLDLAGSDPGDPNVVLATTVGAFEVFVLDGGTAQGMMDWLADNDFQQDEAALPILEEYLAEGHLFVAMRLTTDSVAAEVHPIVLRYEGDEPCVPIRLTRIAAQEDLEIRALFLGDYRYGSSNYAHVDFNPVKLDWISSGANYREVVSMALDEPGADGHGFVTEFAGPSDVVIGGPFIDDDWDSMPFAVAESPGHAIELLLDQGLVGRDDNSGDCQGLHPLVEGLMAQWLPTPADVPIATVCSDPLGFANAVDPEQWDGPAFAQALQSRVIEPGLHAEELLETWPYLTRLYTMLSPHEMTRDPMFHATPELPQVRLGNSMANRNRFCDGHVSMGLPDGRLVSLIGNTWPDLAPEEMPWAETVMFLPAEGAPIIEVDNTSTIDALLAAWHDEVGAPRPPPSVVCGDDGGPTDSTASGPGADTVSDGCGCRSAGGAPWGLAWFTLGLLALRRRRDARAT